jgi:flavin reductase (DIM6/NTAB) family NADH-FMN oxidoreductase RutF
LPRVLVGLARAHYTTELVEASGCFALHLMAERHLDWVWRFGLRSGRDADKFDGLPVETGATGSPLLADAVGWLECRVEGRLDGGDRLVYLAEVVRSHAAAPEPPLTARHLLELAPPELRAELKRQRDLDARADADAIRAWRAGRQGWSG